MCSWSGDVSTPLATRWLLLITSSAAPRSICSIAKGSSGRYCYMAAPPRQALNRAGEDGAYVQLTARPLRFGVNQGRHLRLAAEAAQKGINLLNNLFCSTDRTRREPLMNKSDAQREVIRSRGHPSGVKRTLRSLSAHCRSRPRSRCWCTCPARTSPSTSSWRRR